MTRNRTRDYYQAREAAARAAAQASKIPETRVHHLEMAYRYAALALVEDEPHPAIPAIPLKSAS
jgi:hypothetical protein